MWELINANKRRSVVLVVAMFFLLASLGFLIGMAVFPGNVEALDSGFPLDPTGGMIGIAVAAAIWIVQALIAYFTGDAILLAASGARKIEKEDHPRLFNVVEEMVIASRLPKMPEVYIIEDPAMNAFAAGRKPETAKVAITTGLLERLNRDQLQGVMAHEIAHVVHRDVLFMTMLGVMLGTIVLLSELVLRSMRHMALGGGSRYGGSRKGKGGGGAQIVLLVLVVVLAILAPIIAQVIYFACSRRREYLADAGAAVYTRYPEGLASALEVLAGQHNKLQRVSKATAPMFIVNPLNPTARGMMGIMSTHPPTDKRIAVLRSIAQGVSYGTYQSAWSKLDRGAKMPASLASEAVVPVRGAGAEAQQEQAARNAEARERKRDTGDMMRKLHDFIFIPCGCGTRIKLPPEWKEPEVKCPKCGLSHAVPLAGLAATAAILQERGVGGGQEIPFAQARNAGRQVVEKPRAAWVTVQCRCGQKKNLGPGFDAPTTRCQQCGNDIEVRIIG